MAPKSRPPAAAPQPVGRYGVMLPNLHNPYYAELIQCLDLEVRREQHMIVLAMHHDDPAMVDDLLGHWASGETDGIVLDLPAALLETPRAMNELRRRGMPIVFLHRRPSDDFCLVHHSRAPSYRRALRQLHDLGHRRIGYVGRNHPSPGTSEAFSEYRAALQAFGLPGHDELVHLGPDDESTGYQALSRFFLLAERPTAIVCFNNLYAFGVRRAAREKGLRIPQDLSVVGSGNDGEAERMGLTAVHTDLTTMAREAYRLLEEQRRQNRRLDEVVTIPSELIIRTSVGLAPRPGASAPV